MARVPIHPDRIADLRQRRPRVLVSEHREFIRDLPCLITFERSERVQACHLRASSLEHGKEYTGNREKPDDRWCLPLRFDLHAKQHGKNELAFWAEHHIDPFLMALILWGLSGDTERAIAVIRLRRLL
jgi:hypothetical protein